MLDVHADHLTLPRVSWSRIDQAGRLQRSRPEGARVASNQGQAFERFSRLHHIPDLIIVLVRTSSHPQRLREMGDVGHDRHISAVAVHARSGCRAHPTWSPYVIDHPLRLDGSGSRSEGESARVTRRTCYGRTSDSDSSGSSGWAWATRSRASLTSVIPKWSHRRSYSSSLTGRPVRASTCRMASAM